MTPITPPPTAADVADAIRRTFSDGPGDYRLPDFLAAVDWSEAVRPQPTPSPDLLGRLELWDCEYREGDIGWDAASAARFSPPSTAPTRRSNTPHTASSQRRTRSSATVVARRLAASRPW